MAIPNKDQGQSISIDDIEDEFLIEDDGLGQVDPINFSSFRGQFGHLLGTPLKFSRFSGQSIDPDITPITITGGTVETEGVFAGYRRFDLKETGTLTLAKVAYERGRTATTETITWTQVIGKAQCNLNIDGSTGTSLSFTAPYTDTDVLVRVRATAVDFQGDESYEEIDIFIRQYRVPDAPELATTTVGSNAQNGILGSYDLKRNSDAGYMTGADHTFDLTAGSEIHPYPEITFSIDWEIRSTTATFPNPDDGFATYFLLTDVVENGRHKLRVRSTLDSPTNFSITVRGTFVDPNGLNDIEGDDITIWFARGKNRFEGWEIESRGVSSRTTTGQLPSSIKTSFPINRPPQVGDVALVYVSCTYQTGTQNPAGALDLPTGYKLPLYGESNDGNPVNFQTHWGRSDGWSCLCRVDGPRMGYYASGTYGNISKNIKWQYYDYAIRYKYEYESVRCLTYAKVYNGVQGAQHFSAIFYKLVTEDDIVDWTSKFNDLTVFQDYHIRDEFVTCVFMRPITTQGTGIKKLVRLASKVASNLYSDTYKNEMNYGPVNQPYAQDFTGRKNFGTGGTDRPKTLYSLNLFSEGGSPTDPYPYYIYSESNNNLLGSGITNADDVGDILAPFPDGRLQVCMSVPMMSSTVDVNDYGPNMPSTTTLSSIWSTSVVSNYTVTTLNGRTANMSYMLSGASVGLDNTTISVAGPRQSHLIASATKDYSQGWGYSLRSASTITTDSNYGTFLEQTAVPFKGTAGSKYQFDCGVRLDNTPEKTNWTDSHFYRYSSYQIGKQLTYGRNGYAYIQPGFTVTADLDSTVALLLGDFAVYVDDPLYDGTVSMDRTTYSTATNRYGDYEL